MAFTKGNKANPKGRGNTPNKISATAKDNIAMVFEGIGGLANMARWAKENETAFYAHYAKLIPVQVSGDPDQPLSLIITKVIKNAGD